MSVRANVMLDNGVWEQLKQFPKGERSRAINQALGEWLQGRDRRAAMAEMDRFRKTLKPIKETAEELIRQERASH